MPDAVSTKTLDHIVIRAADGQLKRAMQDFQGLGFTVLTGGKHTGGLTANFLVILSDLSYLEIIAFEHPTEYYETGTPEYEARAHHQWANKPTNKLVAYAFAGKPSAKPSITEVINDRLESTGSACRYQPPTKGGRTRPDGTEMKWELVTPKAWEEEVDGMGRPFFCGDVTARELRVPTDESLHKHQNKALSVAFLRVLVGSEAFAEKSKELDAIIGVQHKNGPVPNWHEWDLYTPAESTAPSPRLILTVPDEGDQRELDFVARYGMGIWGVGFLYDKQVQGSGLSAPDSTTFPFITWIYAD